MKQWNHHCMKDKEVVKAKAVDRKWSKSDFVQVEIKEGLWKVKIYSEVLLVRWGSGRARVLD